MNQQEINKQSEELLAKMDELFEGVNVMMICQCCINVLWNCMMMLPEDARKLVEEGMGHMISNVRELENNGGKLDS